MWSKEKCALLADWVVVVTAATIFERRETGWGPSLFLIALFY